MIKNLMEEKQLDFNAPLLSVRRFSSTSASSGEDKKKIQNPMSNIPSIPYYKSDLKSGPVRNPGVVPFLWEQIPGKPKDGGRQQLQLLEQPPVPPKLPPGRILDVKQRCAADKESKDSNVVSALNENVTKLESSKEDVKDKVNSESEGEDDDAYSDALDTLSRTESFFLNCSVSGISGLDGPGMKPSGAFVTDPQTRDFMMGRFLPAAKAMASETPQYSSRKQSVAREEPRQVRKIVGSHRRPPLYQCKPNIVQNHVQDKVEEQSEDEDDDDYDGSGNSKACGLFPRLCLRNSFFILNPVPGMKARTPVPASSVRKVRAQIKTEIDDEVILQQTWDSVYKDKLVRELQPLELQEDESKMMTSESNQLTCRSDSQTPDRSSQYKHLGDGGGISPYRNEAQQSPFHEGTGFLGIPKEVINLKDKEDSESGSPVVEKTMYVDSVNVVKTRSLELSSSDTKGLMESADGGLEILGKTRGLEETSPAESVVQDNNHIDISEGRGTMHPKILEIIDPNQDSKSVVCSEIPADSNLFDQQGPVEVNHQGNSFVSLLQSPLPPPLLKSPSESWLLRTLPSISSRNLSSRAYPGTKFHPRKQAPKTSPIDPKWENIVRTRSGHHYH